MAFWSSQKIFSDASDLITPFNEDLIDCNAYTLRVGSEFYCTADGSNASSEEKTVRILKKGEPFVVPPGQFAYLLTNEHVKIPADAMAFISVKSGKKLKGLVNVSGFHVDPGYNGKLIFAVYNAAPAPVHLRQGEPLFLIWFADLGVDSEKRKETLGYENISDNVISGMNKRVLSLQGVSDRIDEVNVALESQKPTLENLNFIYRFIVMSVVVAFVVGLLTLVLSGPVGYLWESGRFLHRDWSVETPAVSVGGGPIDKDKPPTIKSDDSSQASE